jgi:hypothetical protein
MPCSIATGPPQAFPVASSFGDIDRPTSSPCKRTDARCCPAQICQVRAGGLRAWEAFCRWFLS